MRRGPTWRQFLEALSEGRSSSYLLIGFLVMVAGIILVLVLGDWRERWRVKAGKRDRDDPEVRDRLNDLSSP